MSDPTFIEPEPLRTLIARGDEVVVVDVRSADEYSAHHIDGLINIPADQLSTRADTIAKDATIVTVCNFGGQRSCNAAEQLHAMATKLCLPCAAARMDGVNAVEAPSKRCDSEVEQEKAA